MTCCKPAGDSSPPLVSCVSFQGRKKLLHCPERFVFTHWNLTPADAEQLCFAASRWASCSKGVRMQAGTSLGLSSIKRPAFCPTWTRISFAIGSLGFCCPCLLENLSDHLPETLPWVPLLREIRWVAFSVVAPKIWNSVPQETHLSPSLLSSASIWHFLSDSLLPAQYFSCCLYVFVWVFAMQFYCVFLICKSLRRPLWRQKDRA